MVPEKHPGIFLVDWKRNDLPGSGYWMEEIVKGASTEALVNKAGEAIRNANRVVAFTGAGISVESGIPPFRGPDGLWATHDPEVLSIEYFYRHPEEAWLGIREIFYTHFQDAKPNACHHLLARMEKELMLARVITQNIDGLHHLAGSMEIIEYHGSSRTLVCTECWSYYDFSPDVFDSLPPQCSACGGLLKPDFVFFGEPIPNKAQLEAAWETMHADVWIIIGTTGEVVPASLLPWEASRNGAVIIEINPRPSAYTKPLTDIFLQGKAAEMASSLEAILF